MTGQLTLDLEPMIEPEHEQGATLDERFARFHELNPHVARLLIQIARRLRNAGHRRIGMKMCAERLRWEYAVQTEGDTFKLNNSYVSRYARLLAATCPDLADAFEMRELRS